jgi:hypothetical protein
MKLENFQGIKSLELDMQGKDCSVYGDNGTGKSTIYNAFTWLMYGKPSTQEKNYTPKTIGSHKLNHVVELKLQLETGAEIVLKKDFHEIYKTVRGGANPILSGHSTDYEINGVPVNETGFKKTLLELYKSEELAKMLTSYDYFLDNMKTADRRRILLEICGDVDFEDVISQNPDLSELSKILIKKGDTTELYTVDEYRQIADKERLLTDKELKDIPGRIDEAQKAKPDINEFIPAVIDERIKAIRDEQKNLELELSDKENATLLSILNQISEVERKISLGETEHIRIENDTNKITFARINDLQKQLSDMDKEILHISASYTESEYDLNRIISKRESLLKEYTEENVKEWGGMTVCPTCKRELPEEQVEESKKMFNIAKAKRLSDINEKGKIECSKVLIESKKEEIKAYESKLEELKSKKEDISQLISEAESSLVDITPYKSTQGYMELNNELEKLKLMQRDIKSASYVTENAIKDKLDKLNEELENEQSKKAQIDMFNRQDLRIKELEEKENELAGKYENLSKGLYLCEQFIKAKTRMLDEKINNRFKTLKFRLFIEQQNGGIADDCEALVPCQTGLVPFKSANNAARINAGLELIDTLSEYYRVEMPLFLDNAESVTKFNKTKTQLIKLIVSKKDKVINFERED